MWPNDEVPGFQAEFEAMERIFRKLASKVLMMIGIGLRLEVSAMGNKHETVREHSMTLGETSKFPFCDHKQTTKDDKRR